MKRFILLFLMVLPALASAATINVGIVSSDGFAKVAQTVQNEAEDFIIGKDHVNIKRYAYKPSVPVSEIDELIVSANQFADIIVLIGDVTVGRAIEKDNLKPIVALFSESPTGSDAFPYSIVYDIDYSKDLSVFKSLFGYKKLKIISSDYSSCSSKMCSETLKRLVNSIDTPYEVFPLKSTDIDQLKSNFVAGDTALVMEQPQLTKEERKQFFKTLSDLGVRTFSLGGYNKAVEGIIAVNTSDKDSLKTARTVAMAIMELNAGKVGTELIKVQRTSGLVINMEAAALAKFSPNWNAMRSAELINYHKSIQYNKTIGYKDAMVQAVKNNENVLTGKIDLQTAKELLDMSKSAFKPTINLSSTYSKIDDDRAVFARGNAPENTFDVALQLQQILYSEEVFSMKDQAGLNKLAKENLAKQAELDVIQLAAKAYLNVLRAKTYHQIKLDDLERSKTNYNLAKNRDLAGAANPAEILRWEATIALAKIDVVNAANGVKMAMTELARIVSEEIDGTYKLEDITFETGDFIMSEVNRGDYILNDNAEFARFKKIMTDASVRNSVELKAIKYLAEANKRSVVSAERKYYHPTVVATGEYKRYLDKSGDGSTAPSFYDNTNWNIAINASIPLYQGGKRRAELNIEKANLRKTYHEKARVTKLIKQRMIAALENARTSYDSYKLAIESEVAAKKTVEIVTDLYSKGAVSITELLDAQNASLNAGMYVASSRFSFMERLIDVERAYGGFFAFNTAEEDQTFLNLINNRN